jgi:hypothetical protein
MFVPAIPMVLLFSQSGHSEASVTSIILFSTRMLFGIVGKLLIAKHCVPHQ